MHRRRKTVRVDVYGCRRSVRDHGRKEAIQPSAQSPPLFRFPAGFGGDWRLPILCPSRPSSIPNSTFASFPLGMVCFHSRSPLIIHDALFPRETHLGFSGFDDTSLWMLSEPPRIKRPPHPKPCPTRLKFSRPSSFLQPRR